MITGPSTWLSAAGHRREDERVVTVDELVVERLDGHRLRDGSRCRWSRR